MRLMISGASKNINHLAQHAAARQHLGVMVTPNTGNGLDWVGSLGLPWVVDNAAFDATKFSTQKYLTLLRRVAEAPAPPVFVAVPDQAPRRGDADHSHCHDCTAYLFEQWFRVLEFEGLHKLPLAFVAQNGLEDSSDVPWGVIDAIFIGGDDAFKLGDFVMMDLIPEAKRRGKVVHMGRVNGRRRLRHACLADVDSVDGTSMSRFGDACIVRFLAATAKAVRERDEADALNAALEEDIERLEGSAASCRKVNRAYQAALRAVV